MNIFDGPPGESLFQQPVLEMFRHNPLPDLFQKAEQSDDRLMTILTALVVEGRLDACLAAFMPRYSKLTKAQESTFSSKIRTMQALDFVPRLLLTAADLIRRMRNEFAHNLDRPSLESLPPSLQQTLKSVRAEVYSRFGAKQKDPKDSLRDEFKALAFFAIAGLDSYSASLLLLRRQIAEPAFMQGLVARVAAENKATIEQLLSSAPESVEERDGMRIERYPEGVVNIVSPGNQE